jgi:hypothetical protein
VTDKTARDGGAWTLALVPAFGIPASHLHLVQTSASARPNDISSSIASPCGSTNYTRCIRFADRSSGNFTGVIAWI